MDEFIELDHYNAPHFASKNEETYCKIDTVTQMWKAAFKWVRESPRVTFVFHPKNHDLEVVKVYLNTEYQTSYSVGMDSVAACILDTAHAIMIYTKEHLL